MPGLYSHELFFLFPRSTALKAEFAGFKSLIARASFFYCLSENPPLHFDVPARARRGKCPIWAGSFFLAAFFFFLQLYGRWRIFYLRFRSYR